MTKRILFVSHDASRTGAPIMFLNFLKWLRVNTNYEACILLLRGGELVSEFENIFETFVWEPALKPLSLKKRVFNFIKRTLNIETNYKKNILYKIRQKKPDIAYLNTVVSNGFIPYLKNIGINKVISHVHENELSINIHYKKYLESSFLMEINLYIAVSISTKKNLETQWKIPSKKINLIYECVDNKKFKNPTVQKNKIREELGIDENDFVIGGAGTLTWRKGIDLFILLAAEIYKRKQSCSIKMIWLGGYDENFKISANYEMHRLGISDMIQFVGMKNDPENYFQLFDVFALTSREDPFPLVAIEVASNAIPIVCFAEAGGIPEMIISGGGEIVPYSDVFEMANSIMNLREDYQLLVKRKKEIIEIAKKFDVNIVAPSICEVIDKVINDENKYLYNDSNISGELVLKANN